MYIYFKTKKTHSETWDKKAAYVLKLSPYKISISH